MPVRLVSQEEPLKGYRLLERLGRGGFGEVWKVEAPGGLHKAMKFVFGDLDAGDDDSRPAEQELKALKRVQTIRHPYVLSLERYDIIEGQLMIVMELADRNLWDRFRECRGQGIPGIPRDELLRYMEEAAEALDLMNTYYQIQHLDIKPQNLFLVSNHVKVGDFGLAKLLEREQTKVTGGVTPVYAAPETFEGFVSRFSDQYSLAIVFQELLTGARPFNGANTRQLLMQHISGAPELGSLPPADRPLIARALSKKPDDRWPSCTELVRGLRGSPPGSGTARQSGATRPPGPRATDPYPGTDSGMATRMQPGSGGPPDSDPFKTQTPCSPRSPATRSPAPPRPLGPMPPLVTVGPAGGLMPKLVTPAAAGGTPGPAVTLQRAQIFQTGRMHGHGIAPPEQTGDGALFPALVVGVGHLGRVVIEALRSVIQDRYGSPEKVPNVRFLYIDTDPEAGSIAGRTPDTPAALTAKELVLAKLNRPTHYLQRDSLPPVDQWMPKGALYKLPRNPGSANGVRAFGRLALFDNYRLVAQRVRQEVETFLTDNPLASADKTTRLGLRTNRPRAYVVAGLGGGTGGGMFLDLAFLIRQEMRGFGYFKPEVVGLFLVPPGDPNAPKGTALGNTHAALTELYHFQAQRSKYNTTFDRAEAAVVDGEPPFARTVLLQLPKALDPKGRGRVTARAARALFDEILTPAGRVVDEVREVYHKAFPSAAPACQALGLFRLSWPRPEVLAAAARRFAQRLLKKWTAKDTAALTEPVGEWLAGQWAERKLGFEHMVERFEEAARTTLREDPEKVFDAFVDPLRTRTPSGGKVDANAACTVLDQIFQLVGKPDAEAGEEPGSLQKPLSARYEEICKEAEVQLATMAVTFIELPQYRLAGAEEAVRQIGERLKRQIDALVPLYNDLVKDVRDTVSRLLQGIAALSTGGLGWRGTGEILDLLRAYPRKRLRLHILALSLAAYRRLHGATPEYLRDIGTCRVRLAEMSAAIGSPDAAAGPGPAGSVAPHPAGKLILPDGCANLGDAAERFLGGVSPADVLAFDQNFQAEVKKKFRGLAAVCLKAAERGPRFRQLLLDRAREFLDGRLDAADPATVFFRCRSGGPDDHPLIAEAFGGANPEITGYAAKKPDEVTILAAPPGEAGERFRQLVAEALPDADLTPAPLPDDIVFYREYPKLDLAAMPQLGTPGREAAEALTAADHPPHARVDIPWQPPGAVS